MNNKSTASFMPAPIGNIPWWRTMSPTLMFGVGMLVGIVVALVVVFYMERARRYEMLGLMDRAFRNQSDGSSDDSSNDQDRGRIVAK